MPSRGGDKTEGDTVSGFGNKERVGKRKTIIKPMNETQVVGGMGLFWGV